MARISGKLSAKSMGWDRNAVGVAVGKVPAAGGRVFIGRIVGSITGLHNTFDEEKGEVQTGLKGEFRGVSSLFEQVPQKDAKGNPVKDAKGEIVMVDSDKPITVTAGRCYLPSGLQDMLETAYKSAALSKNDKGETVVDNTVSISFGVDLYAIPATNKAGYSYDGDTVIDAVQNDPLDMLLASAASAKPMPGLPAPADETAQIEDANKAK